MSGSLTSFLIDTLFWTAALIALVLLIRRPVAKLFGPKAAYLLWALPLFRLLLPPVTLPSWLAPTDGASGTEHFTVTTYTRDALAEPVVADIQAFDWLALGLMAWLAGAAIFLAIRFRNYFRMRRILLGDAHPVGKANSIRLVETQGTNSPIAFGVFDKVIALPEGFMALSDRTERDLALEHEFAHHRAGDLIANFAVQPLFALHWFNPLGWWGWRAMRSDQEAACDARVMSARGDKDRAAYAAIIANYAAGPGISLAAPMACPVIGEKSIIHRLRSLTMNDISSRRRVTGRVLIGAALLAVPLTASISYAESLDVAEPPAAPVAPTPPKMPTPPKAPMALSMQVAPDAPEVPLAPDADEEGHKVVIIHKETTDESGRKTEKTVERRHKAIFVGDDRKMSPEERAKMLAELREELDGVDIEIDEAMEEVRVAMIEMKGADGNLKVEMECTDGQKSGELKSDGHKRVMRICKSEIMASALSGLKEARDEIAKSTEMDAEIRDEVLKALDEKIANWRKQG